MGTGTIIISIPILSTIIIGRRQRMRLAFLLSSLYLAGGVNAGLRSSPETNLVVDDSNGVVYDDTNSHRHELDTHHRQEILHDALAHDLPSSRNLGSDPLLPGISISTRNNCSSNQRGVRIGEATVDNNNCTPTFDVDIVTCVLTHPHVSDRTQ